MKFRVIAPSILAAGLAGVAIPAQSGTPIPNAVVADPKHYTVEFENDVMRLIRIRYEPGETSVMHSHDANCAVFIRDGAIRMELPDGTSTVPPTNAPGAIQCADAETHLPTNVGDTPVEVLLIEMKGRKTVK